MCAFRTPRRSARPSLSRFPGSSSIPRTNLAGLPSPSPGRACSFTPGLYIHTQSIAASGHLTLPYSSPDHPLVSVHRPVPSVLVHARRSYVACVSTDRPGRSPGGSRGRVGLRPVVDGRDLREGDRLEQCAGPRGHRHAGRARAAAGPDCDHVVDRRVSLPADPDRHLYGDLQSVGVQHREAGRDRHPDGVLGRDQRQARRVDRPGDGDGVGRGAGRGHEEREHGRHLQP